MMTSQGAPAPHRRVVITGMGAISPFGPSVAAMQAPLRDGRCVVRRIANIPTDRLSATIAGEIDGFDPAAHFDPKRAALFDRVTQLTVVAGREAVQQAGLTAADFAELDHRAGAVHAASPGQSTLDEAYFVFYGQNKPRVHPLTVPRIMGNGPASALAMEFKLHGPAFGTASACSSSNHAIGAGFDMIRAGRLDVCLVGGSDASLVPGYIKGWEGLRLLATDAPRPFSKDRTGVVLGEAGTVLVLEARSHAEARGAPILAELLGWGTTADGGELVAPEIPYCAKAISLALADAGIGTGDIGYVNAHGTGTRLNDKSETAALKMVFGAHVPPVSSLKSQSGHCLNAAGGMELIATVLAMNGNFMPATANYREPDPDCDIDCIPNHPRPDRFDIALCNSFGFGGLNAVLVVGRA